MEVVILQSVCTEECSSYPEKSDKDSDGNNSLANATAATATARAVVRSLGGEGRDPDDDEETVNGKHNIRVGKSASAAESRSHDKIDPRRDGKEADCKGPSICSQNPGGVAAENGNLQTPRQKGQDDLERMETQLQIR